MSAEANRLDRLLAPAVAVLGKDLGVANAAHDCSDDLHARDAGDVGDHVVQLDVHLHERLLHVLDVRRSVVDQALAMTQEGSKPDELFARAEAAAQQTVLMKLLEPLRVVHVRLATGDILDVPGIHEEHFETTCFQYLKDWYPVDARRFHCNRGDSDFLEPVGERVQVTGEAAERRTASSAQAGGTATT